MEDNKANKQTDCLASGDGKVAILLCKRQESDIGLCLE